MTIICAILIFAVFDKWENQFVQYEMQGYVYKKNKKTLLDQPIAGARIEINGYSAVSDEKGAYLIRFRSPTQLRLLILITYKETEYIRRVDNANEKKLIERQFFIE
jgi:hypothetical protein